MGIFQPCLIPILDIYDVFYTKDPRRGSVFCHHAAMPMSPKHMVAARVSVVINFGNEQQNNCLRT